MSYHRKRSFDASPFDKGQIANHNQDAIYGYIRLNYCEHVHVAKHGIFPVDIIKLIIFFYQDGINWHFNAKQVKLLETANSQQDVIQSAPISINDVVFHYVVYPRYLEHHYDSGTNKGEVRFGLEVSSIPDNIEYMKVYFELYCVETNNAFRSTSTFGTYQNSGSLLELMRTADINTFLQQHNGLTLQGCMDILCIKYREENTRLNHDPRFMDLTRLDVQSQSTWNIEKESIIAKLQGAWDKHSHQSNRYTDIWSVTHGDISSIEKWRIYSSANFNHNAFGLCVSNCQNVNGLSVINHNGVLLSIRMFRIPAKVKQLDVLCKCTVGAKRYKRQCLMKTGAEQSFTFCKFKQHELHKVMQKMQDTMVRVEVIILAVFDYNDQRVDAKKWKEYGILA